MKGCYLQNKIEEDEQPISSGMHFCEEDPCQKMIEEDMARLNNGFTTQYTDEPADFQEWEDQYPDGRYERPALWMVIVMAIGSVLMAYGAMLAVAYFLT
jgi:hypothetical protein